MGLTIYIRLSDEEAELVRGIAGNRHNRWAKHVLLREAGDSIPIEEVRQALAQSSMSQERQELILARFCKVEKLVD